MPTVRPLVLLHPYPADAGFWDPFRAALGGERPVLTPNAPGFGGANPQSGWTIADLADAVAEMITTASPDGTADVMGLSMGGYAALALAVRHPAVCHALVLADTRADGDDATARAGRAAGIAAVRDGNAAAYLDSLLPKLVAPDADAATLAALDAVARRQPPDALIGALIALEGRPDRRAELAGITAPALVIVGEADAVTPPHLARELAEGIPGARLAVVAGAGHLSALERPAEVAAEVRAFIGGLAD